MSSAAALTVWLRSNRTASQVHFTSDVHYMLLHLNVCCTPGLHHYSLKARLLVSGSDRTMVGEALGSIIDNWPGHARQAGRAKLMPFIDASAEQRGTSLELRS